VVDIISILILIFVCVFGRGEEEKSFYGYGFLKVSLW
jgi:hypothetical protein